MEDEQIVVLDHSAALRRRSSTDWGCGAGHLVVWLKRRDDLWGCSQRWTRRRPTCSVRGADRMSRRIEAYFGPYWSRCRRRAKAGTRANNAAVIRQRGRRWCLFRWCGADHAFQRSSAVVLVHVARLLQSPIINDGGRTGVVRTEPRRRVTPMRQAVTREANGHAGQQVMLVTQWTFTVGTPVEVRGRSGWWNRGPAWRETGRRNGWGIGGTRCAVERWTVLAGRPMTGSGVVLFQPDLKEE